MKKSVSRLSLLYPFPPLAVARALFLRAYSGPFYQNSIEVGTEWEDPARLDDLTIRIYRQRP